MWWPLDRRRETTDREVAEMLREVVGEDVNRYPGGLGYSVYSVA